MKKRIVFASVFMVAIFMFATISSAISETGIKSAKIMLLNYLIDDYVKKCRSKCKLHNSRSKNLREAAALASLKVEYLNANKDRLIDEMLEADLRMKKYKVQRFLNASFFNYYASKPALKQKIVEAKLTKY